MGHFPDYSVLCLACLIDILFKLPLCCFQDSNSSLHSTQSCSEDMTEGPRLPNSGQCVTKVFLNIGMENGISHSDSTMMTVLLPPHRQLELLRLIFFFFT